MSKRELLPGGSPARATAVSLAVAAIMLTAACVRSASDAEQAKAAAAWVPVQGRIMTRWAADVKPASAHGEYPRPQLKRDEWLNLNGMWEYAIRPAAEPKPSTFDGHILVPFPIESALSGVGKAVGKDNRLWYRRIFRTPKNWRKSKVLLNFEAVDWETRVWVNGREVGTHCGGYDPFSFDITDDLRKRGDQEIVISVLDPADKGTQPRGKQIGKPEGIWYTSVTGIWATVWLEPVPAAYIARIDIVPDIDRSGVKVKTMIFGNQGRDVPVEMSVRPVSGEAGGAAGPEIKAKGVSGDEIWIPVPGARIWSPDSPSLYELKVSVKEAKARKNDSIEGYFAFRKITLGKDDKGVVRMFLNNRPVFCLGTLDQGWWPDGLYAAPSDEAIRSDLEGLKSLGFNTLRKHVKVEPRRYYYLCDQLGLMVWQDMPSGDAFLGPDGKDIVRRPDSALQYEHELAAVVRSLRNEPCIVMWVPFNEGWGQFDTARITDLVRSLDPTRLVDSASGGADRGTGDVADVHSYPGPDAPAAQTIRAAVLGEFGGLGLPINGHTWQAEANWGYLTFHDGHELTDAYLGLIDKLRPLAEKQLSAAIYTQTTDVEIEVNGLMTYDRAVLKMDKDRIAAANRSVYPKK